MSNDVEGVVRSGFCSGCGLCESIVPAGKIQVSMSNGGFLRPKVNGTLSKADINLFRRVCPGIGLAHATNFDASTSHPIWGPLRSIDTGYATDGVIRRQGSSGGVISALAVYLLETKKVDFIAQNAADPADPVGNLLQRSRTREDVLRAAGSRYGPAAPLKQLRELLATGERFVFIGKPCDVAALRMLARQNPQVDRQVPFMFSFMCAGVPSRKGSLEVLDRLGVNHSELVSFRYRGDGWPGKARAQTIQGDVREMDYSTSWGEILNKHLQFRCKICPDGTGEFADIVCADAWYGKDGYPAFEEREGRSLVLGRSEKGAKLLADAFREGAVSLESLPIDEIAKMQPYQVHRKQVVLGRVIATRLALGTAPTYKRLGLFRASLKARPLDWVRNAVGTFRRAKGEKT